MINTENWSEFARWQVSNPDVFHWKVVDDHIEIISMTLYTPQLQDAQRMAKAFRLRNIDASQHWRRLSTSGMKASQLLMVLDALGLNWEQVRTWTSFLYFDGDKHVADYMPLIGLARIQPNYFCRYADGDKRLFGTPVRAETPGEAAQKFWQLRSRNHPLPQVVEVSDRYGTFFGTIRVQMQLTTTILSSSQVVDK